MTRAAPQKRGFFLYFFPNLWLKEASGIKIQNHIKPMKKSFFFWRAAASFLLAALLFAVPSGKAQTVNFPDPNLEAAVRDALQIYSPTPVDQTNMLTLTNLPAAFRGIQDLSGLETASNLVTLDLGFNSLTNLSPLAGLTKL